MTNDSSVSRSESVRQRRKQQEVKKLWSSARTVSHSRVTSDRATPNWKRHTATISGTSTRRWNAAASAVRGGNSSGLRALANVLPNFEPSWRMASGAIVMVLLAVLFHLLSSPRYFINSINLSGAQYVPGEELYQASGVDNLNIFWLDPQQIRANVAAVPGIKEVAVEVRWPNQVYVAVVENVPVLVWSQAGQTTWVDRDGVVFPARGDVAGLLPIAVDDATYALTTDSRIPKEAIDGALQLKQLRNNIELLHYDAVNGLSYQDGRNWRGYFGVGTEMETKLKVYETLIANLLSRNIHPTSVNVVNADAPYYRR
jgi:cell division septal protein FtsQ